MPKQLEIKRENVDGAEIVTYEVNGRKALIIKELGGFSLSLKTDLNAKDAQNILAPVLRPNDRERKAIYAPRALADIPPQTQEDEEIDEPTFIWRSEGDRDIRFVNVAFKRFDPQRLRSVLDIGMLDICAFADQIIESAADELTVYS